MYNKTYTKKNDHKSTKKASDSHTSAYELMEAIEKDKSVKVVDFTVPYDDNICLYDISLKSHGQDEDQVYAFEPWYRSNVRRGNTVIQIFQENSDKVSKTFYARRGFEKFFDLMVEYMKYNIGEIKDFGNFGIKNVDEHFELHNIIFGGAQKSLQNKKQAAVYKCVKANGENAQISWVGNLGAWLIASKNVSLLARTEEDISKYEGERFHFAKLIAKEWFRYTERLNKEGQLEELKQYLNGKTFVGEYCGNQAYQHLVKYTEIDIIFVAVIDNESKVTSLPPSEAFKVFEKYKLKAVGHEKVGVYNNWNDLNRKLIEIYKHVAEAYIDSEEEGCVVYLSEIDPDSGKEVMLSLTIQLELAVFQGFKNIYLHLIDKLHIIENRPINLEKILYGPSLFETSLLQFSPGGHFETK